MATAAYNWFDDIKRVMDENSDPRSKNLMFMESPLPLVIVSISYLYFVCKAGPKYMQHRKPYNLNGVIIAYNIFQILTCSYIIKQMVTSYFSLDTGNKETNQLSENTIVQTTWVTAFLKLTELIETVFFVLRKKQNQVSGLHLYHHVSTLSFAWITSKFFPGEPIVVLPIVLNSFIHVLMYTYYLVALLGGKQLQQKIVWLKKGLTTAQMVQFGIIMAHLIYNFREDSPTPRSAVLLMMINILINFFMFFNFYKKTYKKKV